MNLPKSSVDVHFGVINGATVDWRRETSEVDPDDELTSTPPDVIAMLGFDPAGEFFPGDPNA